MKNIIVTCSLLILLLMFPVQDLKDISTNRKIVKFDLIVTTTAEKARQEGYFTPTLVQDMKNQLLAAFPENTVSDISISVTDTPKYRLNVFDERECINYDIGIKIKDVIAMGDYFGLSDDENSIIHHKKGYVLSEVNMP